MQNTGPVSTDFIYMGFPRRVFDKNVSFGFDGKSSARRQHSIFALAVTPRPQTFQRSAAAAPPA